MRSLGGVDLLLVQADPGLPRANMALFGFQSVEDWFGVKFLDLTAEFVLNAGILAEQEGYLVTVQEAHVELFSNAYRGMKACALELAGPRR